MRYLFILMFMFSPLSQAAEAFGKVHDMFGTAYVSVALETYAPVHVGEEIYVGQIISTQENAELHITSKDGGLIALRPNTVFRVDAYRAEDSRADKVHMSLLKGSMRSISGWIPKHNPEAYEVTALSAIVGVRGTDHEITIVHEGHEAGIHNAVYHGATVMRNQSGEVHVPAGHFAFVSHTVDTKPVLLSEKPGFHADKLLYKIEHRFEQRKLYLELKLEEIHKEWLREWHKLQEKVRLIE